MDDIQDIPAELVKHIHDYYHDLQYFVGALAQLSVVSKSQEGDAGLLRKRLSVINGLSVIMSAKTNFLKYLTTDAGDLVATKIPIHRAVKRVISGAWHLAKSRNQSLTMKLEGSSFGEITGPDVFEFIPYLVLENAVKYSPNHSQVTVRIDENTDSIVCRVESLGPEIDLDEETRIYEKGFRGRNAIKLTDQGFGMGLHHAKTAIEMLYRGSIAMRQRRQGPPIHVDGVPFRQTEFSIAFPKATGG